MKILKELPGSNKALVIDSELLREESLLYSTEVYREVIDEFLQNRETILNDIADGLDKAAFNKVKKDLHRLSGAISLFHCQSLVAHLKSMEKMAVNKDLAALNTSYLSLEEKINRLFYELENTLAQLKD